MTDPREPNAGEFSGSGESAEPGESGESKPRKRWLGLPPEERIRLTPGKSISEIVSELRDETHD